MFEDFLTSQEAIDAFAASKMKDYLQEAREINGYSRNLQRADSLIKDGHYYAALVMLASAFEVAAKDIFFRNNGFWFLTTVGYSHELYGKFGVKLTDKGIRRRS